MKLIIKIIKDEIFKIDVKLFTNANFVFITIIFWNLKKDLLNKIKDL